MKKTRAIEILGGTITAAAKAIGVSYQAVRQWPDELDGIIKDRVIAAAARIKFGDKLERRLGIEEPSAEK